MYYAKNAQIFVYKMRKFESDFRRYRPIFLVLLLKMTEQKRADIIKYCAIYKTEKSDLFLDT